ncbi:hypothetical protein A9Q81_27970 [Gammaproteobacteria bacterium 42_54_T18]|nr:hypothetical protein A9Q81_27970 [Gammaproteobacteria bacterium 42_54_T18]
MNVTYNLHDIDSELLDDFICSLYESLDLLEHDLVVLERDPQNEKAIHSLFRTVHTLKGNARMCMLDPLSDYMHSIEDVMSEVRAQRLTFTSLIKEAVLLSLDQMRTESEAMVQNMELQLDALEAVQHTFVRMRNASPMDVEILAAEVIKHLGGEFAQELPIIESQTNTLQYSQPHPENSLNNAEEPSPLNNIDADAIKKDLLFFVRSVNELMLFVPTGKHAQAIYWSFACGSITIYLLLSTLNSYPLQYCFMT